MTDRTPLDELVGPEQSRRLFQALQRGASRRDVLAMLMAGGMQAALAGGAATLAATAHAQTPRKGGRITVASMASGVNDTLDPARQSAHIDYCRGFMFYNGLTALDGTLTPQPSLAEEFTTKDAKTWVFKLRKGVQFHDGKPLTPADVVFSIMRHKDAATASRAKVLADQIESVTATGPNEVTIRLSAANADLPVILGTYHFHIVKEGTTDFSTGIGTGPYKVKEFKPGVRSIAVRNENYWKPNRPYLDEIELVGITDESARVNALLAGQLDLVSSVSPRSVERVMASGKHTIFETKALSYTNLIMRRDSGPGSNPDFVLAMKHLFNREQLLKSIQLGRGVVANDQPIAQTNRFYFKGLPQRPYDPAKAKWHLQKANVGNTPIPVVASPAATNSVEIALVMQHAARQIGLNLDVKRMPADGYWSTHWMKHPGQHQRAPQRRPGPDPDLQVRRTVERGGLEEREVRPAAGGRARRDRSRQAGPDVRRHAGHHPQRSEYRHPDVHLGPRRAQQQAQGPGSDSRRRDDGHRLRRARLARRGLTRRHRR
jgi:peptide/nickel transport system substrate-binding protein